MLILLSLGENEAGGRRRIRTLVALSPICFRNSAVQPLRHPSVFWHPGTDLNRHRRFWRPGLCQLSYRDTKSAPWIFDRMEDLHVMTRRAIQGFGGETGIRTLVPHCGGHLLSRQRPWASRASLRNTSPARGRCLSSGSHPDTDSAFFSPARWGRSGWTGLSLPLTLAEDGWCRPATGFARSDRFQGGARRRPGSSSVFWSRATDSNGDLPGPKPGDLPISPTRENLVEAQGVEPLKTRSLQGISAARCCPRNPFGCAPWNRTRLIPD